MTRFKLGLAVAFVAAVVVVAGGSGGAAGARDKGDKKDKGKINGTRWEYTVKQGGKEVESGTFRATSDSKIFHGGIQIGTYSQTGKTEYKLDITKGKLKGEITLTLVREKPRPVYGGPCQLEKLGKAYISVKFLED